MKILENYKLNFVIRKNKYLNLGSPGKEKAVPNTEHSGRLAG